VEKTMSEQAVQIINNGEVVDVSLCQQGMSVVVKTPEQYAMAGEVLTQLKSAIKQIEDDIDPLIKKAHESHKALTQKKAEVLKPFKEADNYVRLKMSAFLQEQERIQREAQRKAEIAAAEKAAKEREALFQKAAKAEAAGKEEKAEALLEQAENVYVEPVLIEQTVEKTVKLDGGSVTAKKEIEVRVIDPQALCAAIGAGTIPTTVISALEGKLKAYFKMMGIREGFHHGCQIKESFTTSVKA
jgi:hypothetical protein